MSRNTQDKRQHSAVDNSAGEHQAKRPTPPVRMQLYSQLDGLLGLLRTQFVADGGTFAFEDAASRNTEVRNKIRDTLVNTGVVGIINAVDEAGVNDARKAVARGLIQLSRDRVPEEELARWATDGRLVDNEKYRKGIPDGQGNIVQGNCGFAFIYGQRNEFAAMPKLTIGGARDAPFEYQPMHRHNVTWLEKHRHILEHIMKCAYLSEVELACAGLEHDNLPTPMISWDSTKYVYRAMAGTKKTLTVPHVDIYSSASTTHRRQVAIEMSQRSPITGLTRRLCYVPFSNDLRVKRLIAAILKKPDVFKRAGFISFGKDERLYAILDKHAISFNSYHVAMWGDGVVHFEAFCKPCEQDSRLAVVVDKRVTRAPLECIRMIVGPHRPTLPFIDLVRLAVLCERGFLPSLYYSSRYKDTVLHENMMCAKSTQNYKTRRVTADERTLFEDARRRIATDTDALHAMSKMSHTRRAIYGLMPLQFEESSPQ